MSDQNTWALPYHRLPLEQSKKEVRMIEFHFEGGTGCDDDSEKSIDIRDEEKRPISLRMVKASLLEPPKFRALSYVWGPSQQSRSITLQVPKEAEPKGKSIEGAIAADEELPDSCEIEVTDNLFAALVVYRTMSSEDQPAYFWIDALCINQRDNDEKSWQVAMMGDIYKSAYLVMGWLGPYPELVYFRPGEFMNTLEWLAEEGLHRFGPSIRYPLGVVRTGGQVAFLEEDIVEWVRGVKLVEGPFSRRRNGGRYEISRWALDEFMGLAFWRRVWILQEVLLAKDIFFTWGGFSLGSELLFTALRIIDKVLQVAGKRGPLSSTEGIEDVLPAETLWIRATNAQETTTCPMLAERHDSAGTRDLWDLVHWNAICGSLQASMPADYVYGLFGVATDVEKLGIRLNYDRDVADIYTDLTSSCIKRKGLEVIADVQWPKNVANLPSWVPDLSALSSTATRAGIWGSYKQLRIDRFSTGGNYSGPRDHEFAVSSSGLPALVVMGSSVTTVQSFLPRMHTAAGNSSKLIRRIWNIQTKLLMTKDIIEQSATAYRTVEDRHTAFASAIVAGGWERGRLILEDQWSLQKLIRGYRLLVDPVSVEHSLDALWKRVSPVCQMNLHTVACLDILGHLLDVRPSTSADTSLEDSRLTHICHHPGLYYQMAFDSYADQMLGKLNDIEGAEDTMASVAVFLDRMEEVGQGRRLFLSADGYLGLGPAEMQNGDSVVYLDSAEVPFILRPLSTGEFTLVGESYIHGLMDRDTKAEADFFPGPFYRPSPELKTTVHQCPEGERRRFIIV